MVIRALSTCRMCRFVVWRQRYGLHRKKYSQHISRIPGGKQINIDSRRECFSSRNSNKHTRKHTFDTVFHYGMSFGFSHGFFQKLICYFCFATYGIFAPNGYRRQYSSRACKAHKQAEIYTASVNKQASHQKVN